MLKRHTLGFDIFLGNGITSPDSCSTFNVWEVLSLILCRHLDTSRENAPAPTSHAACTLLKYTRT